MDKQETNNEPGTGLQLLRTFRLVVSFCFGWFRGGGGGVGWLKRKPTPRSRRPHPVHVVVFLALSGTLEWRRGRRQKKAEGRAGVGRFASGLRGRDLGAPVWGDAGV